MKLSYEQKQRKRDLETLLGHVEDFANGENRVGINGIGHVVSKCAEIAKLYGFDYVAEDLTGNTRFAHESFKDFEEEIKFSIKSEIEKIDPIWKHRLMQKKVS